MEQHRVQKKNPKKHGLLPEWKAFLRVFSTWFEEKCHEQESHEGFLDVDDGDLALAYEWSFMEDDIGMALWLELLFLFFCLLTLFELIKLIHVLNKIIFWTNNIGSMFTN